MKLLIIPFLFFTLKASAQVTAVSPSTSEILIDENSVAIGSGTNFCVGFQQDKLYFLTANHVVRSSKALLTSSGLPLQMLKTWSSLDLALLQTASTDAVLFNPCSNLSRQLSLNFISQAGLIKSQEKAFVIVEGYDQRSKTLKGVQGLVATAITLTSRGPLLILDLPTMGGMSGGLIKAYVHQQTGKLSQGSFNSPMEVQIQGYRLMVIGVIVARSPDETLTYAVPSVELLKMLNGPGTATSEAAPSDDDLIDSGSGRSVERKGK